MRQLKELPAQLKLRVERARSRHGVVDVTLQTFKSFSLDDGGFYTAAVTYYTFFSIFPMLLFAASILGLLTQGDAQLRSDILEAGVDSVPLIRDILSPAGLKFIEDRVGTLAITATLLALYSGTGAIVALQHSLNRIANVSVEGNWLGKRLRSIGWLAVLGATALLSLGLGAVSGYAGDLFAGDQRLGGETIELIRTGDDSEPFTAEITFGEERFTVEEGSTFADGLTLVAVEGECAVVTDGSDEITIGSSSCRPASAAGVIGFVLGHLAGFLVGVLMFATAYRFLPNKPLSWRDVLPGAIAAAIAFEILKEVGAWYLERGAEGREAAFGVFASAAGLLVASYLVAQITLLAAELNDVLAERRLSRQPPALDDEEERHG